MGGVLPYKLRVYCRTFITRHATTLNPKAQGKKRININKFAGLSRDWVGAKKLFVCFFFGSFLMGEKKHISKIPPNIPGQSREISVYVFFSLCVFFLFRSLKAGLGLQR